MLRGLIEEILLFLTPFVLFALWLTLTRRNPLDVAHWSGVRFALTVTGLLLAIGSLLVAGALAPREQGGYIPPSFVDGELRPGRFGDAPPPSQTLPPSSGPPSSGPPSSAPPSAAPPASRP